MWRKSEQNSSRINYFNATFIFPNWVILHTFSVTYENTTKRKNKLNTFSSMYTLGILPYNVEINCLSIH